MASKANTAEREHMERVRALGCIIGLLFGRRSCCRKIEVHHLTGAGMGKRASHYDTIPLCFSHHSAQTGLPFGYAVHKGTRTFEIKFGTQRELLEEVRRRLTSE